MDKKLEKRWVALLVDILLQHKDCWDKKECDCKLCSHCDRCGKYD